MHGLRVEHRHPRQVSLYRDLAQCLYEKSLQGKVVVVCSNPSVTLSSVRKHWLRMTYKVRVERARTLKAARILELSRQVAYMQGVTFSAKTPTELLEANITFATADDLARLAPECQTLLVTYSFAREKLYFMTAWMSRNGEVVIYE